MQNHQISKSQTSGLYLFNAIVIILILFLQVQSLLGTILASKAPFLSRIVLVFDKVFFFSLILFFLYIKFFGWFVTHDRQGKQNRQGIFVPLKSEMIFFFVLMVFILWCVISGLMNGNEIKVTLNGTFSYIIYFFVFFIFSSLSYPDTLIQRTYNMLFKVALFLSVFAICQEILALVYPVSASWWINLQDKKFTWRMGLFRVPSLLGHPNSIGMLALFFLTIELGKLRSLNIGGSRKGIFLFGLTILLSMSRMAIGSAAIAFVLLWPKITKAGIFLLFLILPLWSYYTLSEKQHPMSDELTQVASYDQYRLFTKDVSLKIFEDHAIFGVGPGMYGGHVSLKYNSPVYTKYGFKKEYMDYLHDKVGTIEQQWLQILAELGVPGFIFFLFLMFTPIFILYRLYRKEKKGAFDFLIFGLMVMPIQMCLYMLGFTVTNQSEWLVPYFAFLGMLVSRQRQKHENTLSE